MTVHQTSRYRFSDTQQIEDASGNIHNVHKIRKTTLPTLGGSRVYTTKAGDTFESIAFREYGDARKWYVIADANVDVFFPLTLDVGVQIVIPNKSIAVLT